jgi:hypothetical protein
MLASRYRLLGVIVAVLSLTVLGAAAFTTMGGGRIRQFEGVQVGPPDSACTSSLEFEDMPGMSLPFELHQRGQVVMLFQGQFGGFTSTADARAVIRFTIDGVTTGSAVAVGNDHGADLQTFGFNVFSSTLGSGPHTAQVLWHTFPSGATSCVEERSLIILRP